MPAKSKNLRIPASQCSFFAAKILRLPSVAQDDNLYEKTLSLRDRAFFLQNTAKHLQVSFVSGKITMNAAQMQHNLEPDARLRAGIS